MRALSFDLWQRILHAAFRDDATEQAVADRFDVSKGVVQKIKRRWRISEFDQDGLPPHQS